MEDNPRLILVQIDGYRPFREFVAELGQLEVIVGANGSGKSSLFELLRAIRNAIDEDIPPGLVAGASIRHIYHQPGSQAIRWQLGIEEGESPFRRLLEYTTVFTGPYGQRVYSEDVGYIEEDKSGEVNLLKIEQGNGDMVDPASGRRQDIRLYTHERLGLGSITNPSMVELRKLQAYLRGWSFYSSFNFAADAIRNPVITEQDPVLREDAGNISDVLQYLKNEHEPAFTELNHYMRLYVPGLESIRVKSYGAPGQVMAFWKEKGVDQELSLADLSDGIFRLLCWTVLCVMPNPPSLICIDEPDQGVHPRTLLILADLFRKASRRTQILLATHNSYFLSMFDLSQIAVMRKEDGRAVFVKPASSKALVGMLEDFGSGEIEHLHKSEELEQLP